MRITICPPGEALGARDLQRWSRRRAGGWSGAGKTDDEWVDRFTRQRRVIECRCGHSAVLDISEAKIAKSKFRCSQCGRRAHPKRLASTRKPRSQREPRT